MRDCMRDYIKLTRINQQQQIQDKTRLHQLHW
jgi:hypothetical protein